MFARAVEWSAAVAPKGVLHHIECTTVANTYFERIAPFHRKRGRLAEGKSNAEKRGGAHSRGGSDTGYSGFVRCNDASTVTLCTLNSTAIVPLPLDFP